jgi:hypothetical protein
LDLIGVSFALEGDLDQSVERLRDGIREGMRSVVAEVAERVAAHARDRHGYTSRTGRLERRTIATAARGSFFTGSLYAEVRGATPYGLYVEAKAQFAFLAPAWSDLEPGAERELEGALTRIVREAGF